jgi:hypothetical protein
MWIGKCNLCGYESRLDGWFLADGKIVQCDGCKKFIARQEGEKVTLHRKYSARPGQEIIVPHWPPVNTLLELAHATMERRGGSKAEEIATSGAGSDTGSKHPATGQDPLPDELQ